MLEYADEQVQQTQTVRTQDRIVGHDHHVLEERIDRRAQTCQRLERLRVSSGAGRPDA